MIKEVRSAGLNYLPPWMNHVAGAIPIGMGLIGLISGGVVVPLLLTVLGTLHIYEYHWRLRTPLIRITNGRMTIYRRPYLRPRRIAFESIKCINHVKSGTIRITTHDNQAYSLNGAMIHADDYAEFIGVLNQTTSYKHARITNLQNTLQSTSRWRRPLVTLSRAEVLVAAWALLIMTVLVTWTTNRAPQLSESRRLSVRAHRLYLDRDYKQALMLYRKAKAIDPQDILTHQGLVWSLLALRQYDATVASANDAITLFPDSWSLFEARADAQIALGNLEEAVESYRRCITLDPSGYWEPWMKLANAQERLEDIDGARATYRDLLTRYPGHTKAQDRIAALKAAPNPRKMSDTHGN